MRALIIGRTNKDLDLCKNYKDTEMIKHQPAPSTFMYDSWGGFGGTVVSMHNRHHQADIVVSCELKERQRQTIESGVKCVLGFTSRIQYQIAKSAYGDEPNVEMIFPAEIGLGGANSGLFAMNYLASKGYDEIYTAGVDFMEVFFKSDGDYEIEYDEELGLEIGSKTLYVYDMEKTKDYIRNGGVKEGMRITPSAYAPYAIETAFRLQEKYPNTKFYKAHTISALPFEIKDPLGA